MQKLYEFTCTGNWEHSELLKVAQDAADDQANLELDWKDGYKVHHILTEFVYPPIHHFEVRGEYKMNDRQLMNALINGQKLASSGWDPGEYVYLNANDTLVDGNGDICAWDVVYGGEDMKVYQEPKKIVTLYKPKVAVLSTGEMWCSHAWYRCKEDAERAYPHGVLQWETTEIEE
jgi:hypothetical protein